MQPRGRYFEFSGAQLMIHELTGFIDGDQWVIQNAPEEEIELSRSLNPDPCLAQVVQVIEDDDLNGCYDAIEMVLLSASVGLILYLEGVLTVAHFAEAFEARVAHVSVVYLPEVALGVHRFPVAIVPLRATDRDIIATIDANSRSVGDAEVYPVPPRYRDSKMLAPLPFYATFCNLMKGKVPSL